MISIRYKISSTIITFLVLFFHIHTYSMNRLKQLIPANKGFAQSLIVVTPIIASSIGYTNYLLNNNDILWKTQLAALFNNFVHYVPFKALPLPISSTLGLYDFVDSSHIKNYFLNTGQGNVAALATITGIGLAVVMQKYLSNYNSQEITQLSNVLSTAQTYDIFKDNLQTDSASTAEEPSQNVTDIQTDLFDVQKAQEVATITSQNKNSTVNDTQNNDSSVFETDLPYVKTLSNDEKIFFDVDNEQQANLITYYSALAQPNYTQVCAQPVNTFTQELEIASKWLGRTDNKIRSIEGLTNFLSYFEEKDNEQFLYNFIKNTDSPKAIQWLDIILDKYIDFLQNPVHQDKIQQVISTQQISFLGSCIQNLKPSNEDRNYINKILNKTIFVVNYQCAFHDSKTLSCLTQDQIDRLYTVLCSKYLNRQYVLFNNALKHKKYVYAGHYLCFIYQNITNLNKNNTLCNLDYHFLDQKSLELLTAILKQNDEIIAEFHITNFSTNKTQDTISDLYKLITTIQDNVDAKGTLSLLGYEYNNLHHNQIWQDFITTYLNKYASSSYNQKYKDQVYQREQQRLLKALLTTKNIKNKLAFWNSYYAFITHQKINYETHQNGYTETIQGAAHGIWATTLLNNLVLCLNTEIPTEKTLKTLLHLIEVFSECAQYQREQGNNIYILYSAAMGLNDAQIIYDLCPFGKRYSTSYIKDLVKNQRGTKTTQLWFTFLYKLYVLFIQDRDNKKDLEITQEAINTLFGDGLLEAFKLKELNKYRTYKKNITK